MNRLIRWIIGTLAVLIGTTGAVFGGVAVVQSWTLADRLSREVPASIEDLERIVDLVRQQGDSTLTLIDTVRDRVRFVGETVEELSGIASRDAPAPTLLESLDPDIEQRFEAAEAFIIALQDSLRSMNRALVLLDSVPFFPRRASSGDSRPASSVADSLNEASALLDEASRSLARIRAGQALTPRQRDQFGELLAEVDFALTDVRDQIGTFFASLDQAGDRLAGFREAAPLWIDRGASVSSVFFVCFAASQLALAWQGVALMRRSPGPRPWRAPADNGKVAGEAPPPDLGGETTLPDHDHDHDHEARRS